MARGLEADPCLYRTLAPEPLDGRKNLNRSIVEWKAHVREYVDD